MQISGHHYATGQADLPAACDDLTAVTRSGPITLSHAGGESRGGVRCVTVPGNFAGYLIDLGGQGECRVDIPNPGMTGLFPQGSPVDLSFAASSIPAPAR